MGLMFCALVCAVACPTAQFVGLFAADHTFNAQPDGESETQPAKPDERREDPPYFDRMGGEA